jgi:hypothetical protein
MSIVFSLLTDSLISTDSMFVRFVELDEIFDSKETFVLGELFISVFSTHPAIRNTNKLRKDIKTIPLFFMHYSKCKSYLMLFNFSCKYNY